MTLSREMYALLACALLWGQSARADPAELKAIREAISKKGLRWKAAATSVSRLPLAARRALLLEGPPSRTDEPSPKSPRAKVSLPPAFDWRNMNGRSYVTPVRAQVGPTCVAYANTAALESAVLRMGIAPSGGIDLSEHAVVACNPGYPSVVAEFLLSTGIPLDGCFPFGSGSTQCTACRNWRQETYRPLEHTYAKGPTLEELKAMLVEQGPVVTGMNVTDDFYSYKSGVFATTTSGPLPGGRFHEVLIVGYDDPGRYFIAKNSWGVDWGEQGYFRIDYSQFGNTLVAFGVLNDTYGGAAGPRGPGGTGIALRTSSGRLVTVVNGGGLGGPNFGAGVAALHSDALVPGPWEKFQVEWLDGEHFALKTAAGTYLTAVNGGGIGGANDGSSPVHTDATMLGPWESLTLSWSADGTATIQALNGRYLTAVNGGGVGGANDVPFHTDARVVGPWETFTAVLTRF